MFRPAAAGVIALLLTIAPLGGREPVNDEINARIRKEGRENSQILRTMHYLADVPWTAADRLAQSQGRRRVGDQADDRWGLTNGRLEPWDFGYPGWLNERFSGFIVSPVKDSLVGEVLAWTPSTNGAVTADAVQIVPPDRPTQEDMSRWGRRRPTPKVKGESSWSAATRSSRLLSTRRRSGATMSRSAGNIGPMPVRRRRVGKVGVRRGAETPRRRLPPGG